MKRLLRVVKVTRIFKLNEVLNDIQSGVVDEDILGKYRISPKQLGRIYCKLFYGGHLTKGDMVRRIEMRRGRDASYIPYAELQDTGQIYECLTCGYSSALHFSVCPRCQQLNLRRLVRPRTDFDLNAEALIANSSYQSAP